PLPRALRRGPGEPRSRHPLGRSGGYSGAVAVSLGSQHAWTVRADGAGVSNPGVRLRPRGKFWRSARRHARARAERPRGVGPRTALALDWGPRLGFRHVLTASRRRQGAQAMPARRHRRASQVVLAGPRSWASTLASTTLTSNLD